ncbi:hypothetical protein EMPS_08214 [Entomortierella parvispora]|uniref:Tail specific protease domain-containing protein n=1 Tax=Entomortierella parvispora TaxID=205924 RepID=A0A9P3HFX5_9FUNG|nr:hypothetical protein EMPS_08214 [Entomortierella parvispora]
MTRQRLGRGVKRIVLLTAAAVSLLAGFSSVDVSAAPTALTGLIAHPRLKRQERPDDCTVLGNLEEPDIYWQDVQRCYQSVPYKAADADAILSTLYAYYRDYYIFIDSAMLENQAKPFTNPPVDVLKELDEISRKRYKGDFEFQSDVELLVNRLNDAHANYMPSCYRHYLFQQPLDLYAPVVNGVQSIRIMNDRTERGLEDCEIQKINDKDALEAIQQWADLHSGYSKDAGVRLNKALSQTTFNTVDKSWVVDMGQFLSRVTLPESAELVYQIHCTGPDYPQPRHEVLKVPWEVYRLMSWKDFGSTEEFLQRCYKDPKTEGAKKRSVKERRMEDLNHQASISSSREILNPQVMATRRRQESSAPSLIKRQAEEIKVANMVYNGTSTAFYQLIKRPTIGVVMIPTHSVNQTAEVQILIDGFQKLYDIGVRNVILDLSYNGGGYVNFAYDLVDWMFPNNTRTSVYHSDLRASMSVKALAREDLAHEDYNGYFNPDSFSDPATEEVFMTNFFLQDRVQKRAKRPTGYTPKVFMNHNLGSFEMEMPWQHDAERIVVLTEGSCGSACGMTLNRLKNRHNVKTYAVGGRQGEPLSMFSFPGASVHPLDSLLEDFNALGVDSPMQEMKYKGTYRVPVMEFFQEDDLMPIEYNPKLYAADFHLDYTPLTARNHELLWEIIANNHWKEEGNPGAEDDPSIEKPKAE